MANRLADETSPYLLQHRHNPVDWYPWGPEALERARKEDRPILLSIGYSSCHWCHVMERESFEDPTIAEEMNRLFVNVKVDREERPDLDSVYMSAVQSMTGQGGWPLTVFLTPEGVPFYGGTYFPPEPRQGMPSFPQVLDAAAGAYRNRRGEVEEAAGRLLDALRRSTTARLGDTAGKDPKDESGRFAPGVVDAAARALLGRFDPDHGGFGSAPKFPQAPVLDFLLRYGADDAGGGALDAVERSLDAMARGGIRDHLGGGFHRYTVDAGWLVPHFEKMLYDNALLARLYLHFHLLTGEERWRRVAEETLDWILDDMRSQEGGLFSARDADSEGVEGRFYVWSLDEVEATLDAADLFVRIYDVTEGGNWEGTNILHLPRPPSAVAEELEISVDELERKLASMRARLLERRSDRKAPLRDEKVLAGWNGLALRALAEAGPALGRPDYLRAAEEGARFVLGAMRQDDRLHRAWTDGALGVPGFLEDYASMGNALLTLHEATLEPKYLIDAEWCCEKVVELFWDEGESLFFDSPTDGEALVVRPRDATDNPSPSGTSLAVELLLRSAVVFGASRHRTVAEAAQTRDPGVVQRHPSAFGTLLATFLFRDRGPVEVALVGAEGDEGLRRLTETVHGRYLPERIVVGRQEEEAPMEIPLLAERGTRDGKATAYVCRDYACREPTTDPKILAEQLDREAGRGSGETPGR